MGFGNVIVNRIKQHYTVHPKRKSESQEEREKYIFGCLPFNRWALVPAAVLVQLCIGSLYAWSVFNVPIEEALGLQQGAGAIAFYIAVGCFGLSAAFMGPWLERNGPTKTLCFSSTMLFLGNLVSALGVYLKIIGLVYFGYGVIGGIGFGVSYISPVSPMQKWFPSKKGLLSGVAVCGFGGGSMISAQAQKALIKSVGIELTFVILGAIYFSIMIPMAFILRTPPNDYVEPETAARLEKEEQKKLVAPSGMSSDKKNSNGLDSEIPSGSDSEDVIKMDDEELKEPTLAYELLEALSCRDYWLMYIVLFTNSVAGLLTISKFADICQKQFGKDMSFAADMVSINAAFNLAGRLVYGAISDRTGQKPILVVSLFYQTLACALVPTFIHHGAFWPYAISIWLLSSFYGGGFGLMPAFLTAMFGSLNIGALHGIILTGWSCVALIGGFIFTAIYKDQVESLGKESLYVYDINFYWITALIFFGFVCSLFIRTELRDRLMEPISGQMFRLRLLGGRVIRMQWLKPAADNKEWKEYLR